ncbi:Non-heme 11 kDa protein of cytochrome bc1 complex [Sarocladium strictum]
MGIWDAFTDMVEAVTPWSVVEAEAPAEDTKQEESTETETKSDDAEEEKTEESSEDAEEEAGEDEEEEEEEEEEEDDEEEIVDPKETIEEECKNAPQCAPAKHHYDDCAARVQKQEAEGEVTEDCVEEFFHLAHCATACAAPRLWSKLK